VTRGRGVTERPVTRVEGGRAEGALPDAVAVEEPLEIRLAGETLAVVMRTPGEDAALALGFLFAEGLLASADDVDPPRLVEANVVDVAPRAGRAPDPGRVALARRGTITTAACGVCGRKSIADLLARAGRLAPGPAVPLALLAASTGRLREAQPSFRETGALHGAAALDLAGRVVAAAEDVGRHNAVDKVLGALLARGALGEPAILAVSGRISFEIVAKAAAGRIPVVAGVSAPTSLAIDLAAASRITLAGFVREGRLNLYACKERVLGCP
jgi:FdhD protein